MMDARPTIMFRVDGSTRLGSGHLMRCLTLADAVAMRGIRCIFVSRDLHPNLAAMVLESGHEVALLHQNGPPPMPEAGVYGAWLGTTETHDANAVIAVLDTHGDHPILVVVDHYGIGIEWETLIRKQTGAAILAIDDLGRRHASDFVLDVTFGKSETDYDGLIQAGGRALVGPNYALLRPDFARLRREALATRDARLKEGRAEQVLVSMGGADEGNASHWVIEALVSMDDLEPLHIHVLAGAAYPHLASLEALRDRFAGRLTLHCDVREMAALLADMDIAIGGAGSSSWERCCLGLPTINLILADNQRDVARRLTSAGATIDGGRFPTTEAKQEWADRIVRPAFAQETLSALSRRAREIVDGRGAARVVGAAFSETVRHSALGLRPVSQADATLLYEWQCDPVTRRFALNSSVPVWTEHLAWLSRKLDDKDCSFYIALSGGIAAGMARLDRSSSTPPPVAEGRPYREISVVTAPEFHGCGVASRMLAALQLAHPDEVHVARVLEANTASRGLFAKAGFSSYAPQLLYWIKQPSFEQ